jgi:signal transduction histidine kinase
MRRWPRFRRHSLTGKLVLLFLAMAVLFVILVGGTMGKIYRDQFNHNIRPHLSQYLEYVQRDIGSPPNRQRALELASKLHVDIYIVDADGSWSTNGKTLDYEAMKIEHRFQKNSDSYGITRLDSHEIFMARSGASTVYFDVPNMHPERRGRGWTPLVVMLIVLYLLYYFTRRIIRPVATLSRGVQRFGHGELDYRIKLKRRDELGDLAKNFNEMADELQQMLDAKRQLLLAISHELRTPLTRAKVSLELMDDGPYRQGLGKDLAEMERLIEELLETERLSSSHHILNKQPCSLNSLIAASIQENFPDRQISVSLPGDDITLELDEPRIKLLLKNLVDNALRHTPKDAAALRIALQNSPDGAHITIQDYGEGIAAEHIPHLTEPFYRGDASRRRGTGGYGLGLYLCRVITEAHGGQLSIQSQPDSGTTVSVTLRLTRSSDLSE